MIKIGNVVLGNIPRVVLVSSDVENGDFIEKAKAEGADILELRIDLFRSIEKDYIVKLIKSIKGKGLPIIATIRKKEEDGKRYISDDERLKLFNAVIPLVDAIDIELESKSILKEVIRKAHANKKTIIISYHNLTGTPLNAKLEDMIKKASKIGGDIVKIAAFTNSKEDVIRLMKIILKYKSKNIIIISMGSKGVISRVFFPFMGSLLTYGYINVPSAPGQFPINILIEELRRFYPEFNESLIKRLKLMENI